MLTLDSREWKNLRHAYGSATDIPALLEKLTFLPVANESTEPWFSLWSALAHQGDVYPASFAAVPHIIQVLASLPKEAPTPFFHLPTWIEICRQRNSIAVPEYLADSYFSSIQQLGSLANIAIPHHDDADSLHILFAAVAISKGHASFSEALLELDTETTAGFLTWLGRR